MTHQLLGGERGGGGGGGGGIRGTASVESKSTVMSKTHKKGSV